jgi:phytanoyl-CoA hydroxylase
MNSIKLLSNEQVEQYRQDFETTGYALARGLFSNDEVDELREHFTEIHRTGVPGKYEHVSLEEAEGDALLAYPRVMNPHRFSDVARRYFVDPRVAQLLRAFLREEPVGAQTMFYFKPPGSRGQVMHQDQFYLQVKPGTCIAAWTALDYCDRENGGMIVVPLTQSLAIDCSNVGQPGSYDKNGRPISIPKGYRGKSPTMQPGDTLFFNGSLIHGSGANRTKDRFRRAFISHYAGVGAEAISASYHPLVTMDGNDVEIGVTTEGGPCGGYVGAAH